jgi:hypothetical protein
MGSPATFANSLTEGSIGCGDEFSMNFEWRGFFEPVFELVDELPRILIPRTSVNKGKGGEGRGHSTMALQVLPVRVGVRFLGLAHR